LNSVNVILLAAEDLPPLEGRTGWKSANKSLSGESNGRAVWYN